MQLPLRHAQKEGRSRKVQEGIYQLYRHHPSHIERAVEALSVQDKEDASIRADKIARATALQARWNYENTIQELLEGDAFTGGHLSA